LRPYEEREREGALVRAIEVGVFCLEGAGSAHAFDFVRGEVASLLAEVGKVVATIPTAVEPDLIAKIGVADGQALAPIGPLLKEVSTASTERPHQVQALLRDEIDALVGVNCSRGSRQSEKGGNTSDAGGAAYVAAPPLRASAYG